MALWLTKKSFRASLSCPGALSPSRRATAAQPEMLATIDCRRPFGERYPRSALLPRISGTVRSKARLETQPFHVLVRNAAAAAAAATQQSYAGLRRALLFRHWLRLQAAQSGSAAVLLRLALRTTQFAAPHTPSFFQRAILRLLLQTHSHYRSNEHGARKHTPHTAWRSNILGAERRRLVV